MNKKRTLIFLCLFFFCTIILFGKHISSVLSDTQTDINAETFSCVAYDDNGTAIQGFKDDVEGVWYLFIPSTQSIPDVKIHYEGNITDISEGDIDKTNCTISGAFKNSGDEIEITINGSEKSKVILLQSNLPGVMISLQNTTLDQIHLDKDAKYEGNSVYIADENEEFNLKAEETVEIKGRGNSTWNLYDKKAYQIKFEEKTSVLGMNAAKKWVLLANSSDDSMVRTRLVSKLAKKLDLTFSTSFEYVDLWIDGEYLGTYLIGEKVEIGSSRLNLENDSGALFEQDEAFYSEEDTWFYNETLQRHFVLKEIGDERFGAEAAKDFNDTLNALMDFLYSTPCDEVTLSQLELFIDIDSFIKYYLVNEYVGNREAFATSFYWYKDGASDVLHLGPLWDFDTCMGNDGTEYTKCWGDEHVLFRQLLAVPQFKERTEQIYLQYKDAFYEMINDIDVIKDEINSSAQMNYLRWDVLGKSQLKEYAVDFHATFDEAVDAVKNWLEKRYVNFSIPDCDVVNVSVNENDATMDIYFKSDNVYDKVQFAVWAADKASDTARWYTAEKENGAWICSVPLSDFEAADLYQIDVCVNDVPMGIANGFGYMNNKNT